MKSFQMRIAAVALTCLTLIGCTTELDPELFGTAIGDFRMTHLQVTVDDPIVIGLSRKLDDDTLKAALSQSLQQRFSQFEGTGDYVLSVQLVGYVLAQPGIPVLLAPRSLLGMNVSVFVKDNGEYRRLNEEAYRLVTFEDAGGDTVVGSGYTQTAEEQLHEMAENAAVDIEKWMRKNPDWFVAPDPVLSTTGTASDSEG